MDDSFLKVARVERKRLVNIRRLEYEPEVIFWPKSRLGGVNPEGSVEFLSLFLFFCCFFVCLLVFFFYK